MKFYQSKEFKKEETIWNETLKKESLNLKNPDQRTINFENKDKICDFFLTLDCIMGFYPEMPPFERQVMQLYSQGVFVTIIAKNLKARRNYVHNIINRYKGLVFMVDRMRMMGHFPLSMKPESLEGSGDSGAKRSIQDKAA